MYPVPQEFLNALSTSHQVKYWADIYSGVTRIAEGVKIVGGSVSANAGNEIRYTGSVTLDFDFEVRTRDLRDSALNVYSSRIALYMSIPGVTVSSGPGMPQYEYVLPLGKYRVTDVTQTDRSLPELTLEGYEGYLVDHVMGWAYDSATNTVTGYPNVEPDIDITMIRDRPVVEGIEYMIRRTFKEYIPPGSFNPPFRAMEIKRQISNPEDLYTKVQKLSDFSVGTKPTDIIAMLASTIDVEVFCGPDGVFYIRDLPSKKTRYNQFPGVWLAEGGKSGVLTTITHGVSRDVFNGVIAVNEPATDTTAPVVAEMVVDDDPNSPVYWYGPFGKKPTAITGKWTGTEREVRTQARWAALMALNDALGFNRTMSFSTTPNPALEPNDLVYVRNINGDIEKHVIKSFSIDLTVGGTMSFTTEAKSDLRMITWGELPPPPRPESARVGVYPPVNKTPTTPDAVAYRWQAQDKVWRAVRSIDTLRPTT
jgi:hypothetical protein